MLFTSYIFYLLLLALLLALRYTRLPRVALVNAAGLVFYGAWNPAYCLLLVFVILTAHYSARLLAGGSRRGLLAVSLGRCCCRCCSSSTRSSSWG